MRRCLRQAEWRPYQRAAREDTLLAPHATHLRQRAAEVGYSAQVLFQELRRQQYQGSYETVKWFVRPLRETPLQAAVTRTRVAGPHECGYPRAEPGDVQEGQCDGDNRLNRVHRERYSVFRRQRPSLSIALRFLMAIVASSMVSCPSANMARGSIP